MLLRTRDRLKIASAGICDKIGSYPKHLMRCRLKFLRFTLAPHFGHVVQSSEVGRLTVSRP